MNDTIAFAAHYRHWGWVALLVVLAAWIRYRFAVPRHWREWAGAGLVQAFILAQYAEMYGFPLTLYLLTGFLGFDLPLSGYSGHLWATLLGYGLVGAIVEMLLGGMFVIVSLALLVLGWAHVYAANRHGLLATRRLYGVIRHPQYTGIVMAVFGQIVHWPTLITLALFPAIVFAYTRLAKREERALGERFGDAYLAYRRRVPMFLPRKADWGRFARAQFGADPDGHRANDMEHDVERRSRDPSGTQTDCDETFRPVESGEWRPPCSNSIQVGQTIAEALAQVGYRPR